MPSNGIVRIGGFGITAVTLIARATIQSLAAESIIGVMLFASAGDLAWWPGWAYMVVLVLGTLLPLLGLLMAMFIVRTILEDRILRQELPGHMEYAECVKWKLVNGIW
jgi:hypothetical protein